MSRTEQTKSSARSFDHRNAQNTPWQVDAVKVAPAGQEPNWANVDPVKTIEYYASDSSDGRTGMLKKETVGISGFEGWTCQRLH